TPCRLTSQIFCPHSLGKLQETYRLTGINTIAPTNEVVEKCLRFWRKFLTWYLAWMMLSRHLTKRNSRRPLIHFWIVYRQRKEAFLSVDTGTPIEFQKLLSGTI